VGANIVVRSRAHGVSPALLRAFARVLLPRRPQAIDALMGQRRTARGARDNERCGLRESKPKKFIFTKARARGPRPLEYGALITRLCRSQGFDERGAASSDTGELFGAAQEFSADLRELEGHGHRSMVRCAAIEDSDERGTRAKNSSDEGDLLRPAPELQAQAPTSASAQSAIEP